MNRIKISILAVIVASIMFSSCKTLNQIKDSIANLQRLEFMLDNVNNFVLAGVNLSNIKSVNDLSVMDGIRLTKAFAEKRLPAQFVLNVDAKNPNDGTGGSKRSSATLTGLDWRLYIDGKQTIAGDISNDLVIPGTGKATNIPLTMSIDLYEFFWK